MSNDLGTAAAPPSRPPAIQKSPTESVAGSTRARQSTSFVERYALVGLLVLAFALRAVFLPEFRSTGIVSAMVNSQAIILLLALAATLALRTGDFDLAIPGVMVTSACVVAVMSTNGYSPAAVIPAALAVGLIVGLINALLVVKVGVDSFITTLGMFTALSGIGYAITGSKIVTGVPDFYVELSRAKLLGLPMTTWYGWLLVAVLWFVYQRTPMGRYMLFIGGNRDAALLAGISVARIRTITYVVSGVAGALIGIILVGNLGAIDPGIGSQYLLAPFAATFLGATAITVGRFNAIGTLVAVYLLVVGITGLQLAGAASWVSPLFNGLALMIAVALAKLVGKRRGAA
ncbi:ABC transporter permease [Gordonia alkanivorans]|uniref:Putative ABC transporter permease protein n=1 Tax=Gordonia alkanivorans NBRC 16433 TaxID=1027371 RepID=F9VVX2_9ACTN|nr:ABC transporter permease [Gordonia alkanivorans]AZZ80370.1 ABC transporter permease [Gordonia alkanivorans]GAA12751.1 putative ABC transporter permease protein [Gordonia alkanivorans NBRC 16433]